MRKTMLLYHSQREECDLQTDYGKMLETYGAQSDNKCPRSRLVFNDETGSCTHESEIFFYIYISIILYKRSAWEETVPQSFQFSVKFNNPEWDQEEQKNNKILKDTRAKREAQTRRWIIQAKILTSTHDTWKSVNPASKQWRCCIFK